MTNFIRMLTRNVFVNVFKSDAVIWWAAIFRREEGNFARTRRITERRSNQLHHQQKDPHHCGGRDDNIT